MLGLGACRSKKWRVVGPFLPTPLGSVQMILWRNPQFPSQTKYGGFGKGNWTGKQGLNILVYLGCMVSSYCTWPKSMLTTRTFLSPWWCILWNLVWKEFLLFCMTSFSQIQKKTRMHFFPNRLKKKSFNFFSSWICPFLVSEKKTEWSWHEIFRKNGQDSGLDGNELLCYRRRLGLPKSQEIQPLEGTAFVWQRNVFQRGRGDVKWVDMFFFFVPILNDGIWWFTRSPVLCFRKLQKGTPKRGRFPRWWFHIFSSRKAIHGRKPGPFGFLASFLYFLSQAWVSLQKLLGDDACLVGGNVCQGSKGLNLYGPKCQNDWMNYTSQLYLGIVL